MRDFPHHKALLCMAQGTFKLPRDAGQKNRMSCPKEQPLELATRVISYPEVAPDPGNRAYNKMGRARDAGRHDIRRVQSFSTG